MGSKGSAQQTTNQSGTSTYTANPLTLSAGAQALGMAQNAANSQFSLPVQQYAGFTPDQLAAFQQTRDASQSAQPYYQQAQGLYQQSAQPISAANISHYMDPYAGQVLANLRETQGQQMNDVTGRLTQQAGGVGGDRIGVAQGELARQQSLATGQTLSGIYGNALSAAQQDAARQQSAASGLGNLGSAAQNSGLQGANSLYGMGLNQQGLAQNQLNAQYQNQLAGIAFPYQNAQYLAGITGGLAGAMGGTTVSNQSGQGTSTPAQPSLWSQLLGAGIGGAGLYKATDGFGGLFSGSGGNTSGLTDNEHAAAARGGRIGYAEGGGISGGNWMAADPTIPNIQMQPAQIRQPEVKFAPMPQQSQQSSGGLGDIASIAGSVAKFAPLLLARGGTVGDTPFQGYAEGGGTGINGDEPYRMVDPAAMDQWRRGVIEDVASGVNPNSPAATGEAMIPQKAAPTAGNEAGGPTTTTPYSPFGGSQAAQETALRNKEAMQKASYVPPYPDVDRSTDTTSRNFARSPWTALMNAGFGMMAGTSPFAGVNIGAGLQQGIKTLENQRKEDREDVSVNQRAKQLAMQADQHLRQYTQMTPTEAANVENQRKQRELQETQIEENGWKKGGENLLTGDSTWFNPRSGQSGILTKDGQWKVLKPGEAPPPVAGTPAATPPATPPPPAPFNEPSLASRLEAPKSEIPYIGKGSPMAAAANKELQTTIAAQAKAAQSLPALEQDLVAMKHAFKTLTKDADKDGFISQIALQPGATFGERLEYAKKANALKIAAGEKPPFDPDKVAAAEVINKTQNRMGLTFSSQISPREAFSGQKIGIESSPGLTNTPQGFRKLIAGFEAAAQNTRDEQAFFQNYLKTNGHAMGWRQAFEAQNPSERYVVKGIISTLPENLQKGLPEAVKQLRENPEKYKPIFDKYYGDTSDYFLKHGGG